IQRFACRFVPALCPNLLHLGSVELDSFPVVQFMKTVGRKQNAVSRTQLHDMPSVSGVREHSRGESTLAQLPARGPGDEQGQWHPGIGEDEFPRSRVEKGVQSAAEAVTD